MKTKFYFLKMAMALLLLNTIYSVSYSQINVPADTISPYANPAISIKTNDSVRMTISSNGDVVINKNLVFPDSTSSMHVDSIRCRVIHVGDSSLDIGSPRNQVGTSNFIMTNTVQPICFGHVSGTGLNGNFGGVTIGTTVSSYKLHIHDDGTSGISSSAFIHYTNTTTGSGSGHGFITGIGSDGTAYVWQWGAKPINFLTSNAQRMVITSSGQVGVGGSGFTPTYLFHVDGTIAANTLPPSTSTNIVVWNSDGQLAYNTTLLAGIPIAQNGTSIDSNKIELGGNPLLHNTDVSLAGKLLTFSDSGQVVVGGSSALYPDDKMEIHSLNSTASDNTGLYIETSSDGGNSANYGAQITSTTNSNVIDNFGIQVQATGVSSATIGISAEASNGDANIGVYGTADNFLGGGVPEWTVGVQGFAQNAYSNYGGLFTGAATGNQYVNANIGVYGGVPLIPPIIPLVGKAYPVNAAIFGDAVRGYPFSNLDSTYPTFAAVFNGDVYSSNGVYWTSDSTLKENIKSLTGDSAIKLIRCLKPKTYVFDSVSHPSMSLPRGSQIGLLAENVITNLPQLVRPINFPARVDSAGSIIDSAVSFKGLNYVGLIPIAIAAIKQLDSLQQLNPDSAQNGVSVKTDTIHHYSTPDTYVNHIEWGGTPLLHV